MTNAAIELLRDKSAPDSTAKPEGESKLPEKETGPEGKEQAGVDPKGTTQESAKQAPAEGEPKPDATETNLSNIDKAIEEGKEDEIAERVRQGIEEAKKTERKESQLGQLRTGKTEAFQKEHKALAEAMGLDANEQKALWDSFNRIGAGLVELADDLVRKDYVEFFTATIPENLQAEFLKEVDGQPIDVWLKTAARYQPVDQIASVKNADPETLIKANPKLRKAFEDMKKAAIAEGRELGRADPVGDRTTEERSSVSFANTAALHRAFNNKEISRDVYAREHKRLTGHEP